MKEIKVKNANIEEQAHCCINVAFHWADKPDTKVGQYHGTLMKVPHPAIGYSSVYVYETQTLIVTEFKHEK